MAVAVIFTIASRGLRIFGSGTVSTLSLSRAIHVTLSSRLLEVAPK